MGTVDICFALFVIVVFIVLAYHTGKIDGKYEGYKRGFKAGEANGRFSCSIDHMINYTCKKRPGP